MAKAWAAVNRPRPDPPKDLNPPRRLQTLGSTHDKSELGVEAAARGAHGGSLGDTILGNV